MDFTITSYKSLLNSLIRAEFNFQTFDQFLQDSKYKAVVLRHDVDLLPLNSLRFAKIQADLGIKGSYYFRAVPESWDEDIIKEIAALGHEVGYHYENMDVAFQRIICSRKVSTKELNNLRNELKAMSNERRVMRDSQLTSHFSELTSHLLESAYEDFCINLEKLRKLVPVSTICMHGSPRSKFDNKAIWDKYDYKSLGLIGEPYYDVDFDKVFYLTDTGRRWDGWKTSVRDKVPQQEEWNEQGLTFHYTQDIIEALEKRKSEVGSEKRAERGEQRELSSQKSEVNIIESESDLSYNKKAIPFTGLPLWRGKDSKRDGFFSQNIEKGSLNSVQVPNQVMFTMHPQRWHNSTLPWAKEMVMQNIKNVVKRFFYVNK